MENLRKEHIPEDMNKRLFRRTKSKIKDKITLLIISIIVAIIGAGLFCLFIYKLVESVF